MSKYKNKITVPRNKYGIRYKYANESEKIDEIDILMGIFNDKIEPNDEFKINIVNG